MASPTETIASKSDVRLASVPARSSVLWQPEKAAERPVVRLFGLTFYNTVLETAVRDLILAARYGRRTRVVFVNAHVINTCAADPSYKDVVGAADRIYADGSGLAIAARLSGTAFADNINGTDMLPRLAKAASEGEVGVFLLGSAPGVAEDAAVKLGALRIGGAIVGTHHGHFARGSAEEADVIAAVNRSGARIVLVGLGVPLQDLWIAANASKLDAPVLVGVGGLFDYFAGRVTRAPLMLRRFGLEWTWRLALEPRRLAKRYLWGNLAFLARASAEAIRRRRTPATT